MCQESRYYEQLRLVQPGRLSNGYGDYSDQDLRVISEIRALSGLGINPARAAPFIECLDAGHQHSDECPASLAAYRDGIAELVGQSNPLPPGASTWSKGCTRARTAPLERRAPP
ncbi:MerR family transcriptional regulator [Arthrobacter sp. A5]|uniref:MerR family transcriptional regulator n=1 Tax=Arthrobacter sp. A5 TaxID=576926 RepID=UPI003DA9F0C8